MKGKKTGGRDGVAFKLCYALYIYVFRKMIDTQLIILLINVYGLVRMNRFVKIRKSTSSNDRFVEVDTNYIYKRLINPL